MSEVRLFPNFAAEEGASMERALAMPAVAALCRGWWGLFGGAATLDAALGELPEVSAPAFEWLSEFRGLCPWLSTGQAEARAVELGLGYAAPSPEVAARVHDKAFAACFCLADESTPDLFRAHCAVLEPEELVNGEALRPRLERYLASLPACFDRGFTLKPRVGTSGRGRVGGRIVDERTLAGAARLATKGGAILEPWARRTLDLSCQLYVHKSGEVELLGTTHQVLSPSGVYLGNDGLVDDAGRISSGTDFDEAIIGPAVRLGERAAAEGFWGPCGTDAFVFVGENEARTLRPVVELNARWTGGTVVIGRVRQAQRGEGPQTWSYRLATDEFEFASASPSLGAE